MKLGIEQVIAACEAHYTRNVRIAEAGGDGAYEAAQRAKGIAEVSRSFREMQKHAARSVHAGSCRCDRCIVEEANG